MDNCSGVFSICDQLQIGDTPAKRPAPGVGIEGHRFDATGRGAVCAIDRPGILHSNIAAARPERPPSMHDVRLRVPNSDDAFDLAERRPAETGNKFGSPVTEMRVRT